MSVFRHPEVSHAYRGGRPTLAGATLMLLCGVPVAVLGGVGIGRLMPALLTQASPSDPPERWREVLILAAAGLLAAAIGAVAAYASRLGWNRSRWLARGGVVVCAIVAMIVILEVSRYNLASVLTSALLVVMCLV